MFEIDTKQIVQTLKKELRDYSLRKRKYIEKPIPYRLPVKHRKCTLQMLKKKYPDKWSQYGMMGLWRLFRSGRIQMPPGLPFKALYKPYTDRI